MHDARGVARRGAPVRRRAPRSWSATSPSSTPTCSSVTSPPDARSVFDELRVELCVGQYLDLVGTAGGSSDPAQAARIERYKSGKYTVERPLHLGAALAGRLDDLAAALSAFGLPLGEAFQLRDDLLGVFGDADGHRQAGGRRPARGQADAAGRRRRRARRRRGSATARSARATRISTTPRSPRSRRSSSSAARATRSRRSIERLVDESLDALADAAITDEARAALEELGTFVAVARPVTPTRARRRRRRRARRALRCVPPRRATDTRSPSSSGAPTPGGSRAGSRRTASGSTPVRRS